MAKTPSVDISKVGGIFVHKLRKRRFGGAIHFPYSRPAMKGSAFDAPDPEGHGHSLAEAIAHLTAYLAVPLPPGDAAVGTDSIVGSISREPCGGARPLTRTITIGPLASPCC